MTSPSHSQIDVALRFYGNSTAGYPLPSTSLPSSLSLAFLPSIASGQMVHAGTSDGGTLALQLSNGSVVFEFDLGDGPAHLSTPVGVVSPDQWYQIYATRYTLIGHFATI